MNRVKPQTATALHRRSSGASRLKTRIRTDRLRSYRRKEFCAPCPSPLLLTFDDLTFDDLLGPLPLYRERRAGAGRAHLRIGKLAGSTGLLSYAFSDSEGVLYLEGLSLSRLLEEAIGELEEQGSG